MTREVAAAAIVVAGRVLAARRTGPADVEGGWELPGGKIDAGETPAEAVVREVHEELGCEVAVLHALTGRAAIKADYELTVHVARLLSGEPVPHEHDALRWLASEELDGVDWLPSDRPFLDELRSMLDQGERLEGGNVGGAVRIGRTVRRTTGPWTPAVHALLDHVRAAGLQDVPRVIGVDSRGREALSYLPGRVIEHPEVASDELLSEAMGWLRSFHEVAADFDHPGPWRNGSGPRRPDQIMCHHDFAPYNVAVSSAANGERVVGVFDWDLASPGTRLEDLAFAAWNWVPLHQPLAAGLSARRLSIMAAGYGGRLRPGDILDEVVSRIERSIAVIGAGQAAGDSGMLNLARVGEPARTAHALDDLRRRLPAIGSALLG